MAFHLYSKSRQKKREQAIIKSMTKRRRGSHSTTGGKSTKFSNDPAQKPSVSSDNKSLSSSNRSSRSNLLGLSKKDRLLILTSGDKEDTNNIPGEELLELGLNYLDQSVKCWEIAIESIESSDYMQSTRLALPVSCALRKRKPTNIYLLKIKEQRTRRSRFQTANSLGERPEGERER